MKERTQWPSNGVEKRLGIKNTGVKQRTGNTPTTTPPASPKPSTSADLDNLGGDEYHTMDIVEGKLNLGLSEYNKPKKGNKDKRLSQIMEMANMTDEELGIDNDEAWEGYYPDWAKEGFEPAPWLGTDNPVDYFGLQDVEPMADNTHTHM